MAARKEKEKNTHTRTHAHTSQVSHMHTEIRLQIDSMHSSIAVQRVLAVTTDAKDGVRVACMGISLSNMERRDGPAMAVTPFSFACVVG